MVFRFTLREEFSRIELEVSKEFVRELICLVMELDTVWSCSAFVFMGVGVGVGVAVDHCWPSIFMDGVEFETKSSSSDFDEPDSSDVDEPECVQFGVIEEKSFASGSIPLRKNLRMFFISFFFLAFQIFQPPRFLNSIPVSSHQSFGVGACKMARFSRSSIETYDNTITTRNENPGQATSPAPVLQTIFSAIGGFFGGFGSSAPQSASTSSPAKKLPLYKPSPHPPQQQPNRGNKRSHTALEISPNDQELYDSPNEGGGGRVVGERQQQQQQQQQQQHQESTPKRRKLAVSTAATPTSSAGLGSTVSFASANSSSKNSSRAMFKYVASPPAPRQTLRNGSAISQRRSTPHHSSSGSGSGSGSGRASSYHVTPQRSSFSNSIHTPPNSYSKIRREALTSPNLLTYTYQPVQAGGNSESKRRRTTIGGSDAGRLPAAAAAAAAAAVTTPVVGMHSRSKFVSAKRGGFDGGGGGSSSRGRGTPSRAGTTALSLVPDQSSQARSLIASRILSSLADLESAAGLDTNTGSNTTALALHTATPATTTRLKFTAVVPLEPSGGGGGVARATPPPPIGLKSSLISPPGRAAAASGSGSGSGTVASGRRGGLER